MPIRMSGLVPGVDAKLVEQLVEVEKQPIIMAKKRKEKVVSEKKEFEKLQGLVNDFDKTVGGLKTKSDFNKLKIDSSHPDIIDGVVSKDALVGAYEFEVRGLARADKELAIGFPDKDKTEVGFGFIMVERKDKGDEVELSIDPGSTLQDVARKINEAELGVKAMVINTKYTPDSYRLLVVSEQSGEEARILIDPDTTFLEFKEQVVGTNLDVLFEDVPVTNTENKLDELLEGVVFNIKRSEPGTRVSVNIVHDLDKTIEGIKAFIDKYNSISTYIHDQYLIDPDTKKAKGLLAADGSVKQIMRTLQGALQNSVQQSKFNNLADIGITTDPKTGNLKMDEAKVRSSLAENYDEVAKLFVRDKEGKGLAESMAQVIRGFRDPGAGVLRSRLRGLDTIIQNQDKDIESRERTLESKEASIRRRFSALEGQMANLQSQGSFLSQRFGGGNSPQGGGG